MLSYDYSMIYIHYIHTPFHGIYGFFNYCTFEPLYVVQQCICKHHWIILSFVLSVNKNSHYNVISTKSQITILLKIFRTVTFFMFV